MTYVETRAVLTKTVKDLRKIRLFSRLSSKNPRQFRTFHPDIFETNYDDEDDDDDYIWIRQQT